MTLRTSAKRNAAASVLALAAALLCAESFSFSASSMTSVTAKGKERTVLSGSAKIVTGSTKIEASRIELSGKDYRYADCTGNVIVTDEKKGIFLRCESMSYDRELKVSRVKGQCVMEDKRNEVVIKGGYLENDDTAETAIIQIGVRILKKDMACRSEFAFYDRNKKTLELSGMPVVVWKGDEYRASRISVDLDSDEIKLDGEVQGSIKREDKQKETAPEDKPAEGEAIPDSQPSVPDAPAPDDATPSTEGQS